MRELLIIKTEQFPVLYLIFHSTFQVSTNFKYSRTVCKIFAFSSACTILYNLRRQNILCLAAEKFTLKKEVMMLTRNKIYTVPILPRKPDTWASFFFVVLNQIKRRKTKQNKVNRKYSLSKKDLQIFFPLAAIYLI